MFRHIKWVDGVVARIFGLQCETAIQTIFLVTGVYLDPSEHSLVDEAYVLPMTFERMGGMITKNDTADEPQAWKIVLPATVETCRNWGHKETCEYPACILN